MSHFAKQVFLAGLLFLPLTGLAAAQDAGGGSSCQDIQPMLAERQELIAKLNSAVGTKKKQLDPKEACAIFTKLSNQGSKMIKWFDENKAWCQIPDDFVENMRKDQGNITNTRAQACKVAAQMDAARKNAQNNGAPPSWGGGVHGQYQMPKGAL